MRIILWRMEPVYVNRYQSAVTSPKGDMMPWSRFTINPTIGYTMKCLAVKRRVRDMQFHAAYLYKKRTRLDAFFWFGISRKRNRSWRKNIPLTDYYFGSKPK